MSSNCYCFAGASSSQGPLPQGRLKAKVVAADSIRAADSLKEVVVYKIRAADANGEWTVSRRYSNFEQLHRQLRDVSALECLLECMTAHSCILMHLFHQRPLSTHRVHCSTALPCRAIHSSSSTEMHNARTQPVFCASAQLCLLPARSSMILTIRVLHFPDSCYLFLHNFSFCRYQLTG